MSQKSSLSAYFSVREYGYGGTKAVYIFGGWKTIALYHLPMIRSLVREGYHCVLFIPRRNIVAINRPYEHLVTASDLVTAEVERRVRHARKRGVSEFVSFGISLGTLFATEFAKKSPEVSKLVLLSPFGDFASHVEIWPNHWYFGRILASQPTTREESAKVLNKIGIVPGLELLKDKQVFVGYSNKDNNIHTRVIEEMIRQMREENIDVRTVLAKGGHVRGLINLMIINPAYEKFLFEDKKLPGTSVI